MMCVSLGSALIVKQPLFLSFPRDKNNNNKKQKPQKNRFNKNKAKLISLVFK